MGYDVWAEIDTGGSEPATVGDDSLGYTSNVGGMFRKAFGGDGIKDLDGLLCEDAIGSIEEATADMRFNGDDYSAMNPDNGWGDSKGAREFLVDVWRLCYNHPKATLRVDA